MTHQRFLALLQKYTAGNLTNAETQEWLDAFSDEQYRQLFEQHMQSTFDQAPPWDNAAKEHVLQKIRSETGMKRRFGWAAAAAVLLLIAGYLIFNNNKPRTPPAVVTTTTPKVIPAPQTNRAVITLDNGRQVFLDSMGNGAVASQGNVKVTKLAGGQIAYTGTGTQLSYNTLSNPKGSRVINMTFSDGSKVWLNAGSSLRYPVAFVGTERKVEITGEAYFEVAHDKTKPFRVVSEGQTVEVLGTHFNVNAYPDEGAAKTTLLEGSVKIKDVVLKPRQQAVATRDSRLIIHEDVDLDEVMAWKNERFLFGEKADIGAIMRQISRWYDVEVVFKGNIDQHLGGSISRHENVDAVLKMLEKTGAVRFNVSGRLVTVLPYSY